MSLSPKEFASIFDRHEAYWDDRRAEMRRMRHAYLMRFWDRDDMQAPEDLLVETARAYELVESFVASLFVRDPSVVIKPDIHGHGDPRHRRRLCAVGWGAAAMPLRTDCVSG